MIETIDKPLKIVNASAGSGKTYQLVTEYLLLLLKEKNNLKGFANIIAMTFTNKAALEMKERIVKTLDQLSYPENLNKEEKEEILNRTKNIGKVLKIDEKEVQYRSKSILTNILHQYEDFHVMTIDKFNLKLIKSFSKDLNLPNDFEVIIDENEIIEKVVDNIIGKLGEKDSERLNNIIFYYAKSNINDGNKWNFRQELIKFCNVLKDEKNIPVVNRLMNTKFSTEEYEKLIQEKGKIDNEFLIHTNNIKKELHLIDENLLPNKSRTYKAILKVTEYNTFYSNNKPLFSKSFFKNLTVELKPEQVYPESIKNKIYQLINFWEVNIEHYSLLKLFLENFFNLALLQFISKSLTKIHQDEKLIRISEFNSLISDLIKNESTPFIYERLGNKFNHFLLDEFQDTSRLQWLNLVPLIKESISKNNKNFIVGDPKQSIYRFKNGIAEQFSTLPEIYNPEEDPKINLESKYFSKNGIKHNLKNNWRSSSKIVHFNNVFFNILKKHIPSSNEKHYHSIDQKPMSKVNGKVEIISKNEKKSTIELLPKILNWIKECENNGFKLKEICILGDKHKELNIWALGLNEAGYKVLSKDSLLINSSLRVRLTIAFLYLRLNPLGQNEIKRFAELFFRTNSMSYNDYKKYIIEDLKNGKNKRRFDNVNFLKTHFGGANKIFFKYENLYDLIQHFYAIIGYNELKDPYLHHLSDLIFEYDISRGPNLNSFLKDYERRKNKISVQIPESDDAIQLMTIHKSKGLEFPVVIIPKMSLSSQLNKKFLLDVDNFIVYKTPSKESNIKKLKELHELESNQIISDNFNKCYVAMTRPIERLYISNFFDNNSFGRLFHESLKQIKGIKNKDDILSISDSDGPRSKRKKEEEKEQLFNPKKASDLLWFPNISLQDNKKSLETDYLNDEKQFGEQFHYLASIIKNKNDIDKKIKSCIKEGTVSQYNSTELKKQIMLLFNNHHYVNLFKGNIQILNEQDIIINETSILRPDKIILKKNETIIIDFKTGKPKHTDDKQVKEYQLILEKMKYPNVKVYLFYTAINELRIV